MNDIWRAARLLSRLDSAGLAAALAFLEGFCGAAAEPAPGKTHKLEGEGEPFALPYDKKGSRV